MSPAAANVVGFAGMACIIFAYWYITYARGPNPFVQHGVNLAGAALLTVSLLVNMNPASLALEFFWAGIAIGGLVKAFGNRATGSPSRLREGLGVGGAAADKENPPPAPPASGRGEA